MPYVTKPSPSATSAAPVKLDCGERVDGRELVGNEHRAARPQQPVHLGERELGSRDVVQRARRADEVERAALVRQRGRVRLDELDVRGRPLAALFDQLRDDVDAGDLAHERGARAIANAPAPVPDIERALLARQRQQVAQPLLRRCRAAVLLLRDELSRFAEAFRTASDKLQRLLLGRHRSRGARLRDQFQHTTV